MLKKLEQKIQECFSSSKYPGDDQIVPIKPCLDLERQEIKETFQNKRWEEINYNYLEKNYDGDKSACLNFMTYEAFRYYLPSYMLICIQSYEECDVLYEALFSMLTKKTPQDELFIERLECFDDTTKKVIAEFIWSMHKVYSSKHDPFTIEKGAFISYWSTYFTPDEVLSD